MSEQAPRPTRNVARNVRAIRQRRGMSASRLAQRMQEAGCEINRQAIANLENGRRGIVTVDELFAFAHVFGVDRDHLLCAEPECLKCFDHPPSGFTCNTCGKAAG